MCGKEEEEIVRKSLLPVIDFTYINLVLSLTVQSGWHRRHFDFQNAFQDGKLDCPMYISLQKVRTG